MVYVGLMGLFEKRRFRSFLQYVDEFDPNEPKTFKGFDVKNKTMKECYEKFGLDENTADFTGHALALYLNDELVTVVSSSNSQSDNLLILVTRCPKRRISPILSIFTSTSVYLPMPLHLSLFLSLSYSLFLNLFIPSHCPDLTVSISPHFCVRERQTQRQRYKQRYMEKDIQRESKTQRE